MDASEEPRAGAGAGRPPQSAVAGELQDRTDRSLEEARHLRQRLRELAGEVAGTENSVAVTYQHLAEQALRQGRLEDARRLEGEASAALRAVEHERWEVSRWPNGAGTPEDDWSGAERGRVEARRARDRAAEERDAAAELRDEAAQERDSAAVRRDERAVERALASGRRDDVAAERNAAQERWEHRRGTHATGWPGESTEEQAVVDEEMAATWHRQADADRSSSVADRAADDADREATRQDRRAAGEGRDAARDDREAAARDRAAAEADRDRTSSRHAPD